MPTKPHLALKDSEKVLKCAATTSSGIFLASPDLGGKNACLGANSSVSFSKVGQFPLGLAILTYQVLVLHRSGWFFSCI